jgi:hypothetical protein
MPYSKKYCEFSDDGIVHCDGKKFDCYDDDLLDKHCYDSPQRLRGAECNGGIKIPDNCPGGTSRNDFTGQCLPVTNPPPRLPSTLKATINIIIKNIIEGTQPIGSFATSSNTTGKLFREFNNRTNAATGLVVTDTTMAKNQFVNGQIEITGHLQNMRPTSNSTSAAPNINTARMIVVVATFYDSANNVINTQHTASDPNTLTPGQSGVFHLIVNNAANNIGHVTYLVQWLGISGGNGVLHPTTYEVKAAAATTFPAAK